VGAVGADFNGRNSGSVFVLSGADGSEIARLDGENAGDLFGCSVAAVDMTGDGIQDIVVGSPFYAGSSFFEGRITLIDGASLTQIATLDGLTGELFGVSLAGLDFDGDGSHEVAVCALGSQQAAGAVHIVEFDGSSLVQVPGLSFAGSNPGDWFGFSQTAPGDLNNLLGGELVLGAPYASATGASQAGKVIVLSSMSNPIVLNSGDALAAAGISVGAMKNASGQGYLAAGAPQAGAGDGRVYLWDLSTGAPLPTLMGAAGDQLGRSLTFHPDANFDNLPDLVVGAPGSNGMFGGIKVLELASQTELFSMSGSPDSAFGFSVATIGDTNSTGHSEVLLGAPRAAINGGRSGAIQMISPPDTNLDDPDLSVTGTFIQGGDLTLDLINIKENADLYYYSGRSNSPTTTSEGFSIDIGTLFGGVGGGDAFLVQTNITGGTASAQMSIPAAFPPGQGLYLQVVEERSGFTRKSDVEAGQVLEHDLVVAASPNPTAGSNTTVNADYAWPGDLIYFFVGNSLGNSGYLGIIGNTLLANPILVHQTQADAQGQASATWNVPATYNGNSTVGATIWFSAVSWRTSGEKSGLSIPYVIG